MGFFASTPQQKQDQQMQSRLYVTLLSTLVGAVFVKLLADLISVEHTSAHDQTELVMTMCIISTISLAPRVMRLSWKAIVLVSMLTGFVSVGFVLLLYQVL